MSPAPKKKRYEGLIQFKDFLRQNLVCLQAALQGSFATAVQCPLVARLDQLDLGCYHLIVGFGRDHDLSAAVTATSDEQLLIQLHQKLDQPLSQLVEGLRETQVGVWIDSADLLAGQYFYNILANLMLQKGELDRRNQHSWGSVTTSFAVSDHQSMIQAAQNWLHEKQIERPVADQIQLQIKSVWPLLKNPQSFALSSDGSYLSLTITGSFIANHDDFNALLLQLKEIPSHCITLSSWGSDQIDFCIPIRFFQRLELKCLFAYHRFQQIPTIAAS